MRRAVVRRWTPSPLWMSAPTRLLRSGLWGPLVLGALLLLATAGAAPVLFYAYAADAAWRTTVEAVPVTARAADAPVVRLNGGAGPEDSREAALLERLAAIPGLGPARVVAGSVGTELAGRDALLTPFVRAGDRTERARLYADQDLADALVPAPAGTSPEAGGLWLPAPVAARLGVGAGDRVEVGVSRRDGPALGETTAPAEVAGTYAVGADGRRPADPSGTGRWTARVGQLPADTEFPTRTAALLVGDVETVQRLAEAVGDELFWTAEAGLATALPPLPEVRRTADRVARLGRALTDPGVLSTADGPLRTGLVSGLPDLAADAVAVRDATVARTSTLAWAGVVLGLLAVVAVAVLGTARRRLELALDAELGTAPAAVGARAGLEVLPAAVLAGLGGPLLAQAVLGAAGAGPAASRSVLAAAAANAAQGLAVAVLLVALVAGCAAAVAARPARAGADRRRLPWEVLLAVAAVTAVLGLTSRPERAAPAWVDLLVPVLVVAAVGAVGGRLLLAGLARAARRLGSARPGSRRSAVGWLALRRLSAPDEARLLVVTVLVLGLGMQLFALSAAAAVADVSEDRAAVAAGAQASIRIPGSWLLDDDPVGPPDDAPPGSSLPEVRTPELPDGATLVWQRTGTVPGLFGYVTVLVVDPGTLRTAAAWGRGPELARARALLDRFAAADRESEDARRRGLTAAPVPAVVVGSADLRRGQVASVDLSLRPSPLGVPVEVLDVLPAFPGADGTRTTVVVGTSMLARLGHSDPRRLPPDPDSDAGFRLRLWSADGPDGLDAVLSRRGVEGDEATTLAQARQRPDLAAARRSLGYSVALAGCVALLAVVALCLLADRSAARGRAADLLLRRAGLGRAGPVRARVLELALTGALALVLAVLGVLLLSPLAAALVDGAGGARPVLTFRPTAAGLAATAGTAVVATALASAVVAVRARTGSDGQVLRDAD